MRKLLVLCIAAGIGLMGNCAVAEEVSPLKIRGTDLGRLELPIPDLKGDRESLGLLGTGSFRLPQIKADLLIVEVFSMYCPYCQAEAENVNSLYEMIRKNPGLRNRVKLIGIGTGNTPFEVNFFKKKFKVPFPLIPDENMAIQKCANKTIRTPTFVTIRVGEKGSFKILDTHVGKIENLEKFLESVSQKLWS